VQFVHRLGAYLLLALALWHAWASVRRVPDTTHARRALALLALVVVQALVGIVTVVGAVPFGWALVHQGMALVVLGFAVAHWRAAAGAYPPETAVRAAG